MALRYRGGYDAIVHDVTGRGGWCYSEWRGGNNVAVGREGRGYLGWGKLAGVCWVHVANDVMRINVAAERDPLSPPDSVRRQHRTTRSPPRAILFDNTYHFSCYALLSSSRTRNILLIYLLYYILFYLILYNYSHCAIITTRFVERYGTVARDKACVTWYCWLEGRNDRENNFEHRVNPS